jgi:hypothetical protein
MHAYIDTRGRKEKTKGKKKYSNVHIHRFIANNNNNNYYYYYYYYYYGYYYGGLF